MERYYDLIVSLVKNHKKYHEYKNILDDIVNDVYEQASIVLKSVTDENLISSYLEKIVSSSMISVPKKLGISSRRSAKIDIQEMLNSSNIDNKKEEKINEEIADVSFSDNDNELFNEILQEDNYNIQEDNKNNTEELLTDIEPIEDTTQYTEYQDDEISIDRTLVDKMINGVSAEETQNKIDNEAETIYEELNTDDTLEVVNDEPEPIAETVEEQFTPVLELDEPEKLEVSEFIEEVPLLNESISLDNSIAEYDLKENSLDMLYPEPEYLAEDNDYSETADTERTESETDNEPESVVSAENINTYSNNNDNFTPPSYKKFTVDYEQYTDESYVNELKEELTALDKKYPDKNILAVYKLKYNENKTIDEISSELSLDSSDILDTLNEIIYLVKG